MLLIQKVDTVVGPTSLGKFTKTVAGQALANIPGWGAFFDADYYERGSNKLLNRVTGKSAIITGSFAQSPDFANMIYKTAESGGATHVSDYDVNPDAWTFFLIAKPRATSASYVFRLVRRTADDSTNLCLNIAISASSKTLSIYRTTAGVARIEYTFPENQEPAVLDRPTLIMFTFSKTKGLAIRVNGVTVATSSSEAGKNPIVSGYRAGEWDWFRNAGGSFGAWGGLNINLLDDANTEHLATFENYFKSKYGIY
ncbi:hypothetical protein [Acinetobacter radioresistens]|uniref:hypothetical protein n=1 Tax=Acinetobacter radioresistens TaxID=40216 RepID=UPI00124FDB01|nr:hypothetical protein [Acinetobacter radioresistens]